MSAPTDHLSPGVAQTLGETLSRLRKARAQGNDSEARHAEKRLNWLLESRVPRRTTPNGELLAEVDRQWAVAECALLQDQHALMAKDDPRRSEMARQITRLAALAKLRK